MGRDRTGTRELPRPPLSRLRLPRRSAALVLVPLMLAGVLAACGSDPGDDADVARAAAVRVEAEGCHPAPSVGAGAFVAGNRVLTVAHVVAGSAEVDVVLGDGTEHQASVIAIDRQKDLAVLAVKADVATLRAGRMRSGAQGAMVVWRFGQPQTLTFTTRSVVDISAADIDGTGIGVRRGYELDATVQEGDSGSVLVANGLAVGVLFARSTTGPGRAWATDITEAAPLIATANTAPVDTGACS
jgi:S1-C subfamily serine protease